MHKNQKLRLIQEIGFLLELPQPAISTTLQFYRKFTEQAPENQYANEIVVCSCIFLASKIFENEKKIRDILNVINSAIKLYQLASQEPDETESNYIKLENAIKEKQSILDNIQPNYELTMYNELKTKVLEGEQLLLKILRFDFSIAEQKSSNFKQLLGVCDHEVPQRVIQIAVNTYNDLEFCDDILQWIPGIIYFAFEVENAYEENEEDLKKVENDLSLKVEQNKSEDVHTITQKESSKSNEINLIEPQLQKSKSDIVECKQNRNMMKCIEWEELFLVPLKKFQLYNEKVIKFYEKLSEEEFANEEEIENDEEK